MRSRFSPIAALLCGASLISAQSYVQLQLTLSGLTLTPSLRISSACQKSLTGIISSPDAACLNPTGLLPIFLGGSNTSIVPALNNWLAGFCSVAPCSNQTLANIVTNITAGCTTELKALGLGSGSTAEVTTTVQQFYPTVRNVLCLKECAISDLQVATSLTNRIALTVTPPTTTVSLKRSRISKRLPAR